ncbi:glycosyltransferase family 4 protein [Actinokineospora spheciospongiae]|uniref:glycosyltransferase family 4 protein n=1 Tax=Actinokineospora spheciospongiae TaxID=909613 RepID=UPI00054E694E|nr:glycosyltransferase family 4 protein [Actinokineospora spheciospongiae]PWW59548.1 glycosyltransferase involved in cell wall biosynthesis [Actinokineospora spheciospongiae]
MSGVSGSDGPVSGLHALRGRSVLLVNWRDIRHPQAGGAELYAHQIARRWAAAGVKVTWLTSRPEGAAAREVIDGVQVLRRGGQFSLYPAAASALLRVGSLFDAVVDCQNGIPFFAPAFVPKSTAVVQVVHHVHQDQFGAHFSKPVAAVGRFLEGPVSRRVYRDRAMVAVSPSTRRDMRTRLGARGPVFIVPNGNEPSVLRAGPRDPDPTIVLVSRLVAHKRVDLLLRALPEVLTAVPNLRVEVIGDGPLRRPLELLAGELGLRGSLRFRGRLSDAERDELMQRAWLTTSTSQGEGWGCTVLEAARFGVPCLAIAAAGIDDSVLDGRTGWVVPDAAALGQGVVDALTALADDDTAAAVSDRCRAWASAFTWDRSAELLAGVVGAEITRRGTARRSRRHARSDMATAVRFRVPRDVPAPRGRLTDQVRVDGEHGTALLHGCDELDAESVLARWNVEPVSVELATEEHLLTGVNPLPATSSTAVERR